MGLKPFLDKQKIPGGAANWQQSFLRGLRNSQVFLPLLSKRGLWRFTNNEDHMEDNVLIEFEIAFELRKEYIDAAAAEGNDEEGLKAQLFITPIGVGAHDFSVPERPFYPFTGHENSELYQNSLLKLPLVSPAATAGAADIIHITV